MGRERVWGREVMMTLDSVENVTFYQHASGECMATNIRSIFFCCFTHSGTRSIIV